MVAKNVLSPAGVQRKRSDKWKPGHYIKLLDGTLYGGSLNGILDQINASTTIRGVKIVMSAGTYDTVGEAKLDAVLAYLNTGKGVILQISWRAFDVVAGSAEDILPTGFEATTGVYDSGGASEHTTYQYAWSYLQGTAPKGYNLKLYEPTLRAAYKTWFDVLAAKYDSNPKVVRIDTTESAHGSPVVAYGVTTGTTAQRTNEFNSDALHQSGMLTITELLKAAFTLTPICAQINFPPGFIPTAVQHCKDNAIGFGSPNGSYKASLIQSGGVLTFYPGASGIVMISPEIQGNDLDAYTGSDAATSAEYNHPPYQKLYERWRDTHKTNYLVWLYANAYWNGGTNPDSGKTVPSLHTFLTTHTDIVNGGPSGGLNPKRPSTWDY